MSDAFKRRLATALDALGLWVALAILGAVLGIGIASTIGLVDNTAWVHHTHVVIEALDQLALGMFRATSARRGFALTGDRVQLQRFREAVETQRTAVASVRELTRDNESQQRRLDELDPLLGRRQAFLDAALQTQREKGFDLAREEEATREGAEADEQLRLRLDALIAAERALLLEREQREAATVLRTEAIEVVGTTISLALLSATLYRLRREIRRRKLSDQATRASEAAVKVLNEALEERVAERTAELQQANRELEEFSYSVVHDLRAPLRGMGGFAEVLLDESKDTLSAEATDSLREIRENARKMAALIDALVAMSRIARSALHRTEVDLTALFRAGAARLFASDPRPGLCVESDEGLRAHADAALAKILIDALLENAWKFTAHAQSGRIELRGAEVDGERVWSVRDNGVGFDMDHKGKLFAPFGRLHTVAEFPGLGIGLAIAQRAVRRHGGRIWAEGRTGQGATFFFTLGAKTEGKTS